MEKVLEKDGSDSCILVCMHSLTNDLNVFYVYFTAIKNNREKKKGPS